jgi:hypothetical protein
MKAKTWRHVGLLLGAVLASGLSAFGQDAPENPFLPDGYKAAAKPTEPPKPSPVAQFELRSIMVLNGVHTFSLYDTKTKKGFWIDLDETVEGVSISDYNKSDESVNVRSGGYSRRLKLKEAQIVALKVTPPPPRKTRAPSGSPDLSKVPPKPPNMIPGPPPSSPPSGVPSRAAINNLSDEEVRARMQRVAEEIRRRRAMRRTMADKAAKNP